LASSTATTASFTFAGQSFSVSRTGSTIVLTNYANAVCSGYATVVSGGGGGNGGGGGGYYSSPAPVGAIAGGAAGGGVLVIAGVIVAVVVYRRRRNTVRACAHSEILTNKFRQAPVVNEVELDDATAPQKPDVFYNSLTTSPGSAEKAFASRNPLAEIRLHGADISVTLVDPDASAAARTVYTDAPPTAFQVPDYASVRPADTSAPDSNEGGTSRAAPGGAVREYSGTAV
jgi:hypothetical protein